MALIRRGAASKVASLFYLTPPITALMGYVMFAEQLSIGELVGMGIAACGVYLVIKA
jgi:drug/metabolite transporter (DMT)-like permease